MISKARVLGVGIAFAGCGGDPPIVGLVTADTSSGETSISSESSGGAGDSSTTADGSSSEDSEGSSDSTTVMADAGAAEEGPGTSDTSGGLAPFCGDGHVDEDKGEECDDGEEESKGCVLCSRVRLIFLTSTLLQGGKINGLVGADAYCRSLALKAQQELPESPIVDPKNFKALLSTSTESVMDRHFPGTGPYRLVNGLQVSRNFAALFSEPLENPINVDERSETLHAPVWTGTNVDGTPYPGIDFCGDWTDLKGTANFGDSDEVDSGWINLDIDLNPDSDCYSERPIYCVEQE